MKRTASLLIYLMLRGSGGITAQSTTVAAGDWMTYNRTLQGDRYSPLSEINRDNVTRLRPLCTYTLPEVVSLQTGPLVIDGMMYFTSEFSSYAIDASNCSEKWRSVREVRPSATGAHRGFAYLDGVLFRGTSDAHVIALDAKDGRTKWDVTLDIAGPGVAMSMAPIAYDHKVFIGNSGGDQVGVTAMCMHWTPTPVVPFGDSMPSPTPAVSAPHGATCKESRQAVEDSGRRSRSTPHGACSMHRLEILLLISIWR
jgi:glucose dehydrogenase